MTSLLSVGKWVFAITFLLGSGYFFYTQVSPLLTPPCTEPIPYSVALYDPQFGITRAEFEDALADAEAVWEEAAGRDLFTFSSEGGIGVSLVYSDTQKAVKLGEVISSEQQQYDAKKAELEMLKERFERAKEAYEEKARVFDGLSATYHEQVQYWNAQGGAPPEEYERLNRAREALEEEKAELNTQAEATNQISLSINDRVDELNAYARTLNAKVDVYNENAGDEFDQGDYQEDEDGKRISVYEFTNGKDLRRVLIHEFGHALGIGHVENPSSIMYSYNAGMSLTLSGEDVAALKVACKLD